MKRKRWNGGITYIAFFFLIVDCTVYTNLSTHLLPKSVKGGSGVVDSEMYKGLSQYFVIARKEVILLCIPMVHLLLNLLYTYVFLFNVGTCDEAVVIQTSIQL